MEPLGVPSILSPAPQPDVSPRRSLSLVDYFYFHKDDESALSAFRESVLGALEVDAVGMGDLLGADDGATKLASKDFECAQLQVYLKVLSDATVLMLEWSGDCADQVARVESLLEAAHNVRKSLFGETVVFLGVCGSDAGVCGECPSPAAGGSSLFEKRRRLLCSECGLKGESLVLAGDFGRLCHVPPSDEDGGSEHYYLYTPPQDVEERKLSQVVRHSLPGLDMIVRRIERERALFMDRREAIESEHKAMDSSVGRFFHREAAKQNEDPEKRSEILSEEIRRLSQVYAILATDSQLIKEAEASLRDDIESLHRKAATMAGADGARESTFLMFHDGRFGPELKALAREDAALGSSLDRVEAAVDIVRTEVDLLRGREAMEIQSQTRELLRHNVSLQQERMALLVAANVIEFVIIFYYTLSSWSGIVGRVGIEAVPALVRFGLVALFGFAAVYLTHSIAHAVKHHTYRSVGFVVSSIMIVISVALIVGATVYWVGAPSGI